jgi:hypothetical protein
MTGTSTRWLARLLPFVPVAVVVLLFVTGCGSGDY